MTLSFTEAEYTALCHATKKAVWLHQLKQKLEGSTVYVKILTDSEDSVALAKNSIFHTQTKHINIKTHYVQKVIQSEDIKLQWISDQTNPVDVLTKPLKKTLFCQCIEEMKL